MRKIGAGARDYLSRARPFLHALAPEGPGKETIATGKHLEIGPPSSRVSRHYICSTSGGVKDPKQPTVQWEVAGTRGQNGGAGPSTQLDMHKAHILSDRMKFLPPGFKLFYPEDPLWIVRGEGQYLFDQQGVKYLDCVNSISHVGHCHHRVVKAGVEQMATLNINSRYLDDLAVKYAKHLTKTLPDNLSCCLFFSSGSEANDVALRIAKEVTGGTEVIAVDKGYYGLVQSLMDISSYKWKGDMKWCGEHTILAPLPDVYRGKYRDPETAGQLYAEELKKLIDQAHSKGKKIAAFICESAVGPGGEMLLPKDYLRTVYKYVREAGGMCIADEVQVGFGRSGKHFWMFEQQGVVPDLVTMGKGIGNGHPISAVVTSQKTAEMHNSIAPSIYPSYGGNPVSMAIAEATLCVIEDEHLQEHAAEVGGFMLSELQALKTKHPQVIGDVRGLGFFIGVDLVKDPATREPNPELATTVYRRMKEEFQVIWTVNGVHANVLKFSPPMVFSKSNAEYLLASLDKILCSRE